jgi:hypothetical protein
VFRKKYLQNIQEILIKPEKANKKFPILKEPFENTLLKQ